MNNKLLNKFEGITKGNGCISLCNPVKWVVVLQNGYPMARAARHEDSASTLYLPEIVRYAKVLEQNTELLKSIVTDLMGSLQECIDELKQNDYHSNWIKTNVQDIAKAKDALQKVAELEKQLQTT